MLIKVHNGNEISTHYIPFIHVLDKHITYNENNLPKNKKKLLNKVTEQEIQTVEKIKIHYNS